MSSPKKQGEEGGIIRREIPMYASKVMRVCPKCGKATREAFKVCRRREGPRLQEVRRDYLRGRIEEWLD